MSITNYFNKAKSALKKKQKNVDFRGLNVKKNYSSFWMDDEWDNNSKFAGLSGHVGSQSSDIVKLIKLSNYRKAITNFVKIVTKKDIPVQWAGSDSFTDGKAINITTNIKDTNFDVTVGLALHEASHVVLSDFDLVKVVAHGKHPEVELLIQKYQSHFNEYQLVPFIRHMLNWIEDRRIDHYIFSTSPGYKAYYHKLYDHYWNAKDVMKAFLSEEFGKPTFFNYEFHIINMINPAFVSNTLPRLQEIVQLIDLQNISRLKTTQEALSLALQVTDIVCESVIEEQQQMQDINGNDDQQQTGTGQVANLGGNDDSNNDESGEDGNPSNVQPLSPSEMRAIEEAFNKQKRFLDGETNKKSATKKLQRELDNAANQSVEVQTVGDNSVGVRSSLIYDLTKDNKLVTLLSLADEYAKYEDIRSNHSWDSQQSKEAREQQSLLTEQAELIIDPELIRISSLRGESGWISAGLDMGALLGKKLQLHNESRERVDNRLRQGKIDNRRLAHTGYDIENVFKQIHIDKYKKANIHISIDGSGSMNGSKWNSTIQMTTAIAKAATYTQNINVQVSIRVTTRVSRGDTPATLLVYDSRKNKINQLVAAFRLMSPNSMTPEGLCYESMYKKNYFVPTTSEMDSYLLNISDGEPGCTSYHGTQALSHTRNIISKLKNDLNMSVLSFYITSSGDAKNSAEAYAKLVQSFNSGHGSGRAFRIMYGKDATVVDCNSALQIAREMNKKFLTK